MCRIHKEVLKLTSQQGIAVPKHAKFLFVAEQHGQLTVWYEFDDIYENVNRKVFVAGTGHILPDDATQYVGSVLMNDGMFVWHVYAGE